MDKFSICLLIMLNQSILIYINLINFKLDKLDNCISDD